MPPLRPGLRLAAATAATLLLGCRVPGDGAAASARAPAGHCRSRTAGADAMVRWTSAAPAADTAALTAWCETVGPPVFVPAPAPTPAPAGQQAAIDAIAIVSWNVHVGGGDLARLVAELRSGRLTGGRPPAAFVLLLQEVYRSGPQVPPLPARAAIDVPHRIAPPPPTGERQDIVAAARQLGLSLLYVPSMRNGPGVVEPREDRGNAILASLPLADPQALELPLETQRRVVAAATIGGRTTEGAPWSLRLVAAHLDHRAGWRRPLASFGAARLDQARALTTALQGPHPLVLGADLNTWSVATLEDAVPYLRRHFSSGAPEPIGSTFSILGIGRRLDHLFFRLPATWSASQRIVPDRFGSDHHPLLATLAFHAARDPSR